MRTFHAKQFAPPPDAHAIRGAQIQGASSRNETTDDEVVVARTHPSLYCVNHLVPFAVVVHAGIRSWGTMSHTGLTKCVRGVPGRHHGRRPLSQHRLSVQETIHVVLSPRQVPLSSGPFQVSPRARGRALRIDRSPRTLVQSARDFPAYKLGHTRTTTTEEDHDDDPVGRHCP